MNTKTIFDDEARHAALRGWFAGAPGQSVLAAEREKLCEMLPALYGPVAVQLGLCREIALLEATDAPWRIAVEAVPVPGGAVSVLADTAVLPFGAKTVGIVIAPHVLDYVPDPHQVLREIERVLVPEGHLVLTGFNPWSLWGACRRLRLSRRRPPWCGTFYSLARVKDWLHLLDFEQVAGTMVYYRPPMKSQTNLARLAFLEQAGNRWWPMLAGVYIVIVRKREIGVTGIPIVRRRRALAPELAEPAVRGRL
jgi:SAM-dependent methyltransferase